MRENMRQTLQQNQVSNQYQTKTNYIVKSVLLYEFKTCRMTEAIRWKEMLKENHGSFLATVGD